MRHAGDVSEYSEFVAARSGALFRTAYLVVGDHQLAQDLLQESLIKAYVAWPRLRDVSRAEAYTRRIIVTTAISWRRRRSFHERPLGVLPDAGESDLADALAIQDVVWERLRTLPPRQRAAVVLRYYEDLSEVRTAEAMGCSVGTVKSQVHDALGTLRRQLGSSAALLTADPGSDQAVTP